MRLLRLITLTLLSFAASAQARTAADFFVSAPETAVPMLAHNTRLDMLDYFNHGLSTASENLVSGRSRLTANAPGRIEVQLTRDASLVIGLLKQKSDTLLVLIETVHTPVPDSRITLYDKNWQPLRRQPSMPDAKAFVADAKAARKASLPEITFFRADFDPATGIFTFDNTSAGYYTEYDRPEGLALMRGSLEMLYDGKKFIEKK